MPQPVLFVWSLEKVGEEHAEEAGCWMTAGVGGNRMVERAHVESLCAAGKLRKVF